VTELAGFLLWAVIGAAVALGTVSVIGVFVLPLATITALLALRWRAGRRGLTGIISGLGAPLLYVAWLNRDGPGEVCRTLASGGQSCTDEWSPWPWLVAGAFFVLAGVVAFELTTRSQAPPGRPGLPRPPRPPRPPVPAVNVIVLLVAAGLLVTWGGAIVAAPLTLPALFVVARRHATPAFLVAAGAIAALTAAQVAWALTYWALGEARPWVWLLPLVAAVGVAATAASLSPSSRRA
jgi:hypothetical protein